MTALSRGRSLGIGGRMTIAGALVAAVAAGAFVLLLGAIGDLRMSARLSHDSQKLLLAAGSLETLTLQLQNGQRGFLLTGDDAFRRSYDDAALQLGDASARLDSLAAQQGAQRELARDIEAAIRSYYEEYSQPLISLGERDLAAAQARVRAGEGERRIRGIRTLFAELARSEQAIADAREARAVAAGRRANIVAVVAIGMLLALLAAIVFYFIRVVVVPVSRLDLAAQQRAAGDFAVRVAPVGVGEARRLVDSFNVMATALQQNQEELARQFAELRAILDSTDDGITMTAADGSLILSNKRMEQLWQELGVDVKGGIWERLAALARRSGSFEEHAQAFMRLAEDDEFVYESPFEVPELARSFAGYTAPVRGPQGVVIGRLFRLRETTAEQAAERAKEEFLATVSHELRTPLTSIIGYLELVRDGEVGEVTPDQDRFLGIVDRSARHLHGLVDDLLFVGRADEGRLDLDLSALDFADVVSECAESSATAAGEKDVELALDAEPGLDVTGDRRRLTQLVTNLLGNAIKFTPAGGRVQVRAAAENGAAVLEVTDTGIGISAQDQERLFERFFRAATAKGAQVPGTGLGLAISRAIAEAHGGSIVVRSSVGEGATFRVELPMEVSE